MVWTYAIPGSSSEMFIAVETYFKLGALTATTQMPVTRVLFSSPVVPLGPGDIAYGDATPGNPALFNLGRIVFSGNGLTSGTLDLGGGATVPGLTGGTITGIRYYFNDLLSASITQGLPYDPAMSLESNLRLSATISLPNIPAQTFSNALIQTYQQDNPAILRAFFSSFQHVMIGNDNPNTFAGYDGNDLLVGNNGNDFLQGDGGDDTLDGGAGTDGLLGGPGNDLYLPGPPAPNSQIGDSVSDGGTNPNEIDTISYANATSPVSLSLDPLAGHLNQGWAAGLIIGGIERAIGSNFNDTIYGSDSPQSISDTSNDILEGGYGDDTLFGLSGSDILVGGPGFDVLVGGPDGDIRGPGPGDRASYTAFSNEVELFARNDGGVGLAAPGAGLDTLYEVEFIQLLDGIFRINQLPGGNRSVVPGNDAANRLNGTTSSELIFGKGGNDTMSGGGGFDRLEGDLGNDFLFGDGFFANYAPDQAGQVYRLYQATLDRAPDTGGHEDWTLRLLSGERSLPTVAEGFVNSTEFQNTYGALNNTGFVQLLYQNVLNRAADQAGLNGWVNQLNAGASRAQVVLGFSESPEFIANTRAASNSFTRGSDEGTWADEIFRVYQATLDRNPDLSGFVSWITQLSGGASLQSVVGGFVNSTEFQNTYGALNNTGFVQLLYQNVLNRAADQAGLNGWVNQLNSGASRAQVVLGFSESQEFIANTRTPLENWTRGLGNDDVMIGGAGNDVLAGGRLSDVFLFQPNEGRDTVLDLEAWDTLIFRGFGYGTDAAIRSHMTQQGADVVFADQGTTVVLEGLTLGQISDAMLAG